MCKDLSTTKCLVIGKNSGELKIPTMTASNLQGAAPQVKTQPLLQIARIRIPHPFIKSVLTQGSVKKPYSSLDG